MIQRCENPNEKSYSRYGAKGVRVCDRWHDFVAFLEDMGVKPHPKLSIDRIDNSRGYEPGNCRWATAIEQSRNRSNRVLVEVNGTPMRIWEAAAALGLTQSAVRARIAQGTPMTKPPKGTLTAFGERRTLREWAERYGVSVAVISSRLTQGWSPERAVSQPKTPVGRYVRVVGVHKRSKQHA